MGAQERHINPSQEEAVWGAVVHTYQAAGSLYSHVFYSLNPRWGKNKPSGSAGRVSVNGVEFLTKRAFSWFAPMSFVFSPVNNFKASFVIVVKGQHEKAPLPVSHKRYLRETCSFCWWSDILSRCSFDSRLVALRLGKPSLFYSKGQTCTCLSILVPAGILPGESF